MAKGCRGTSEAVVAGRIISFRELGRRSRRAAVLLFKDDSGQAITEYIILLTIITVGAGTLARAILRTLDTGILRLGAVLEKDLKTGRASPGVFRN